MTLITIPNSEVNICRALDRDDDADLQVRISGERSDGYITFDFLDYLYTDITIDQATQIRDGLTAALEAAEKNHPDKELRNEFTDAIYECSYDDLSVTGQETIRKVVERVRLLKL